MSNLWIRSQDKKRLTIVNSLGYGEYRNPLNEDMFYIFCQNGCVLGEYKTKERCIEIIDEIQKLLQSDGLIIMKDIDFDCIEKDYLKPFKPLFLQSDVVQSRKGEITVNNVEDLVYEMPEE